MCQARVVVGVMDIHRICDIIDRVFIENAARSRIKAIKRNSGKPPPPIGSSELKNNTAHEHTMHFDCIMKKTKHRHFL